MSIFVARHSLNIERVSLNNDIGVCSEYLPRRPSEHQYFKIGNSEVLFFYFNAALDRRFFADNDKIIFCHGYGDKTLENRVQNNFAQSKSFDLINFPEAFCALKVHRQGLQFVGSAVGADPIFYYRDDEQIIVTNRHNPLGPWANRLSLNRESLAWMVGRGHIGGFETYWEKIKKTRPGSLYEYDGRRLSEIDVNYSNLFSPINDFEINHHVDALKKNFCNIIDGSDAKCRFWLSGGKDSRAIAGLLSGADRFSDITFHTHGEKFSPDVMAATLVAHELGVLDKHSVARSSLTEVGVDFPRAIAKDLLSDCSGGSFADFRSIPDSDLLIIGGHESGYKVPPNKMNLNEYLDSRKYWPDNQNILEKDIYENIYRKFRGDLAKLLVNAPEDRYPQLESLVYVIGTRVTGAHSNTHVSRSEIHPFLDGRMVRLLFGVSSEALDSQVIHYLMMRQSSFQIESLPFASDAWPKGTLDFAAKIGHPFRSQPQRPYVFRDYFPSQKVFGGYSWRLDLIIRTKKFTMDYVRQNTFFDFIDISQLEILFAKNDAALRISDIYFRLALLKACMVHYFNERGLLFQFSNENSIAELVSNLIEKRPQANSHKAAGSVYEDKIIQYEEAIAHVAERDRLMDTRQQAAIDYRIAKKLTEIIIDDRKKLTDELFLLGFYAIEKTGLEILNAKGRVSVEFYFINTSNRDGTFLIGVKNQPESKPVQKFSWSESGNFWYQYINKNDNEIVHFDVDLCDGG
ncbi:hypothetical protein LJR066_001202 [Acidovorax sp. LjRoot66]|uniref:hypothetical protein n=1 Tax=Acidovorax sp. LjRoot66 TaxID=3342334 RepID=UPI003ECF3F93